MQNPTTWRSFCFPGSPAFAVIKIVSVCGAVSGIRILRFDASLNFSNSDFFESRVLHSLLPSTQVVIMDCSSINDMDVTAIRMLERLVQSLREKGIVLLFANWKGPMRDFLQKASFYEVLPPEHCFLSLPDAVFWAKRRLRSNDVGVRRRVSPTWFD